MQCGVRFVVLGTFDAIVLGQTRFVEIERLCLQYSTVFWIKVDQLYLIKIFCAGPCARGPMDVALCFMSPRAS